MDATDGQPVEGATVSLRADLANYLDRAAGRGVVRAIAEALGGLHQARTFRAATQALSTRMWPIFGSVVMDVIGPDGDIEAGLEDQDTAGAWEGF